MCICWNLTGIHYEMDICSLYLAYVSTYYSSLYYLEFMLTKHWIYPQVTAPVDIKVYRLTETCLHRFSAHQTVQVWTWEQNTFFLWHVKGWTEIKMAKRQGQASCVVSGRALARPRRRRQHNTSHPANCSTQYWHWLTVMCYPHLHILHWN